MFQTKIIFINKTLINNNKKVCKIDKLIIKLSQNAQIYEYQWSQLIRGFVQYTEISSFIFENVGLTGPGLKLIINEILNNTN